MSLSDWIHDWFAGHDDPSILGPDVNPASGLPMVGDLDIAGNLHGTDDTHWMSSTDDIGGTEIGGSSFDWDSSGSSYDLGIGGIDTGCGYDPFDRSGSSFGSGLDDW